MALKNKLSLLNLSAEEQVKAENKFLASLALVSEDEIRDTINYLETQGVRITKAKDLKVITNSSDELAQKFSILGDVHETNIYVQDPSQINRNAIDIFKRIKYCMQIGKPYKKEDGTYETFLFSEIAWQKEMNKKPDLHIVEPTIAPQTDEFVTLDPVAEPVLQIVEPTPVATETEVDTIHQDVTAFQEALEVDAQTRSFANIREDLKAQLAMLENLNAGLEDEIIFTDINGLEPESYEMRKSA